MELAALIAAVPSIAKLANEALSAVGRVRSNLAARNDGAKEQATEALNGLTESLKHAGVLAEWAEKYFSAYAGIQNLVHRCLRARALLADAQDTLSEGSEARHDVKWNEFRQEFDRIDEDATLSRQIILNQMEYYDDRDRDRCELLVSEFDKQYSAAEAHVSSESVERIPQHLDDMTGKLRLLEDLFRHSLQEKILHGLTRLKGV